MRTIVRLLAVVVCAFVLGAVPALPQGAQTGGVSGVVKDSSGAMVPGAAVEVFSETTGSSERSLTTGPEGTYSVTLLPPGTYRLEVTATGFKKYQVVVPVRINETTRHDVTLEVGSVQEAVTVEAVATMVNTESATTGQPIDSRTLAALPLPVPNFLFLLALSPGSAGEPPDVRSANRGIVDINVNGQRTSNNSVSIEGINVNDFNLAHFDTVPLPNPSAIQEFKVATSLYDASMGSKGGGAVTLVLKSGTRNWHGDAYWSHRNDALNANEWFRNQAGVPRAKLLQNVLGFSGSGPIPKAGGFWFANVHGLRARNGLDPNGATLNPVIPTFPTAGDGSTSAALLAPAFGLNASQIDPVAVNILNLKGGLYGGQYVVPRPGQAGCPAPAAGAASFRCTFSKVAPLSDTQYTITYDRPFRGGNDKISVRWFYDNGSVDKPFGTASSLAFPRTDIQRNRFLSVNHTHLLSPRQVNEFRAGFSRYNSSFAPTDALSLKDVGATRPNEGAIPGLYRIGITGLFQLGTGVNDDRGTISNQYQWSDTWSLSAGKHTFRAGFEAIRYQLNRFNRFASRGDLTFGATTGTGNAFTPFPNFLQGRITAIQSAAGDPQRYFRDTDYAAFFQDDWRIHPRLTLNLGLRWEGLGFAYDKYLRITTYQAVASPTNPFVFPADLNLEGLKGTPGIGKCALTSCLDKNNFGPRVGFAWDLRGNQKTVVRGGYGVYYQRLSNQNLLQGSLGPPFFVQLIDNRPTPDALQLKNPLPSTPGGGAVATAYIPQASIFTGLRRVSGSGPLDPNDPGVAPIFVNQQGQACANYGGSASNCSINLASFTTARLDARAPYNQQWNLTIQRQLAGGWAVEAGYVGSHYVGGIGIWTPYLAPLASPSSPISVSDASGNRYTITTNTVANEELRHLVLGLSRRRGARFSENIGFATYHSGQLTLSRRLAKGLFFQGGYTWSKTIDNVSGSQSTDELNATRNGQAGANVLNYQNNFSQNRARGDFDRPHRLVASYSYDLPLPKSGIWGTQIFQGWNISGIVTYQNGLPFSVTDSSSGGAFGGGTGTGNFICRPAAEQLASLPGCTPGAVTTKEQALLSGSIQNRLNNYINPNMFSAAPNVANAAGAGVTGYGSVPRNTFRAPFQQNWDFSVGKKFSIKEKHQVLFRADFFNLFNHPIFQSPAVVSINTPATFTQITTTAIPARLIQFGLRYQF